MAKVEVQNGISSSSVRGSSVVQGSSSGSSPPSDSPDWPSDVRVPCVNAFVRNGYIVGCGDCIPCRARAAKIWANRIVFEMRDYAENIFVTLTYDDEHLPAEGSLHKKSFSAFIKRLRRRLDYHIGAHFRFFACGEYGTRTGRAHYHAILFGVGTWAHTTIQECWAQGFVQTLPADGGAGAYVAGYVVKKLNKVQRGPCESEFILMSRRPGIGAKMADHISSDALLSDLWYDDFGDIVGAINVGRYKLALGGYMRRRIRSDLTGSEKAPLASQNAYHSAVLSLYDRAADAAKKPVVGHAQKALQIEQKFHRSRQNETL